MQRTGPNLKVFVPGAAPERRTYTAALVGEVRPAQRLNRYKLCRSSSVAALQGRTQLDESVSLLLSMQLTRLIAIFAMRLCSQDTAIFISFLL
jgi:hypothetical protein